MNHQMGADAAMDLQTQEYDEQCYYTLTAHYIPLHYCWIFHPEPRSQHACISHPLIYTTHNNTEDDTPTSIGSSKCNEGAGRGPVYGLLVAQRDNVVSSGTGIHSLLFTFRAVASTAKSARACSEVR